DIDFDLPKFSDIGTQEKLFEYLLPQLNSDKMNYIFLDEVQNVDKFHRAVSRLFALDHVDIYITGSNAYMLSGEFATYFTGRYVELQMLPLSLKEYKNLLEINDNKLAQQNNEVIFNAYLKSSFPYASRMDDDLSLLEYMRGIYDSIILKDVVTRLKITDVRVVNLITKFLLDSVGNLISSRKVTNTLTSNGTKVSNNTVDKYIDALVAAQIFYESPRYDIQGKEHLKTLQKYYAVDVGLRNQIAGINNTRDLGHVLENIIFLELKRRGYDVSIGYLKSCEIDFVAVKGSFVEYYQVALSVLDEDVFHREIAPLIKVKDNHPKYLITLDHIGAGNNFDGIRQFNAIDWLLI
ncbi:MAG: ATP-binding protein, partial [Clostridiales Family XIII bacterium]|nr:ATP-binding protein [Clostridiales Family XIII bacterium]